MGKLILLYWGCILLMYLSQTFYPEGDLQNKRFGGNFILDRLDIFLCVIIGWMSAFMFLRTRYNDTGNYIMGFRHQSIPINEFITEGYLFELGANPLHELYKSIIKETFNNYHIYFMFPAILSCVSSIKLFKRFSVNPAFSLAVFFSLGTYIMYLAALKQCIAIAILLFALPYANDKKYVKYYLLVFFAMMFHTHAFIFMAVPFFFGKPWGKLTWLVLAVALLAMATYNITFGALMEFALSLGVNVADFEVFDGHSIHPIRVIIYAIPAVMSFLFRRRLYNDSTPWENLFANLSIYTAFILMIGLIQGANLFARMAAYYEIALSLSFPWMINKVFDRKSANLITIIASVLFFGYFLYEFGIAKDFGGGYRAISFIQFFKELLGNG